MNEVKCVEFIKYIYDNMKVSGGIKKPEVLAKEYINASKTNINKSAAKKSLLGDGYTFKETKENTEKTSVKVIVNNHKETKTYYFEVWQKPIERKSVFGYESLLKNETI